MIDIDVSKVAEIIRHIAATEVLPRFKNLQAGEIREKNPGDFVTVADEASEKTLGDALRALLPGSVVVGEEAVSRDAAVLDLIKGTAPVWIVDPIDGTYNFAHGISKFGILVALVQNGVVEYGWVFDAPGNRMAIAVKGQGAAIDGAPAHIRKTVQQVQDMTGIGGYGKPWHFDPARPVVREMLHNRCAMFDFLSFANGEADFVMHLNHVKPWDHAATVLLVEEAGAYVRLLETETILEPWMHLPVPLLAAADENRWRMLKAALQPVLDRKKV